MSHMQYQQQQMRAAGIKRRPEPSGSNMEYDMEPQAPLHLRAHMETQAETEMQMEVEVEPSENSNPANNLRQHSAMTRCGADQAMEEEEKQCPAAQSAAGMAEQATQAQQPQLRLTPPPPTRQPLQSAMTARAEAEQLNVQQLYAREGKYRVINNNSEYLPHRRSLVDWISEVCMEYDLSQLTIHAAVSYLDRVLHHNTVHRNKLQLVALACILLAAKFDEREGKVPSLKSLVAAANDQYNVDMIKQAEFAVLSDLQWNLMVVTTAHFLEYFLAKGVLFYTDTVKGRPPTRHAATYVQKYVNFFRELCLQDHVFQQYNPSLLASAVVASARRAMTVDPIWPPVLMQLTGYDARQVYPCYAHIFGNYETNFPSHSKEIGRDLSPTSVQEFAAQARRM